MNPSLPAVAPTPENGFDLEVDTLIIGAGACGLVAALAACEAGQTVLVVEADVLPRGSTALSAGLIPAAGTALQRAAGIIDSPAQFAADIQLKAKQQNDPLLVQTLATDSAPVVDWLMERYGLPFTLVHDFDYPGHSRRRMHGLPSRSGLELIDALRAACESRDIDIACQRRASIVHRDGDVITGVSVTIDGSETELIGCRKLILACNGFGGNRDLVARHMPGIAEGLWFGHDGNRGEAVLWGELLGASITHLGAYQGHGNVAHPHGILITWAVITQGGIQVNQQGQRFWDESQGYSEAARVVLAQPGGVAVTLFDERIASIARQFEDFREAETAGAIHRADSLDELARQFSLPVGALLETVKKLPISTSLPSSSADTSPASTSATRSDATETSAGFTDVADEFGRIFKHEPLQAPFYAVRVTGALFHTQGGLMIDTDARVLRTDGTAFPNLFAGGGAACGVSGTGDAGYLSGNGLLSAVVLGYRAGLTAVL